MLVAGMGAGLVQVISSSVRRQASSIDSTRALYIAEAGLSEAFLALAQGRDGAIGSAENLADFGGGYYWVTAEELGSGHVRLSSNGLYGHGRCALAIVVEPSSNPVGSLGVSSLGQIEIGAGSTLNATNSAEGGGVGSGVMLRGNGDIILHSTNTATSVENGWVGLGNVDDEFPDSDYSGPEQTVVHGDAHPGVHGIVVADPTATVTGSTAPSVQAFVTPAVKFPVGGQAIGNVEVGRNDTLTGNLDGGSLELNTGSQLTLSGPLVLVVDSLVASPGAALTIDSTNGPVEIFVKNTLDLKHGSNLANVGQDSTQVALIVGSTGRDTSGRLRVDEQRVLSTGQFFGLIYTPYSQLKIGGNLHVTGAASAGQLHFGPGSQLTYDEALKTSGVGVELLPRQVSWTQEPLPNDPIMRSNRDVKHLIVQLGRTSTKSTDAYSTHDAQLSYRDTLGVQRQYNGDIRVFDWMLLDSVSSVSWFDADLAGYGADKRPRIIVEPDSVRSDDTREAQDTVAVPL